MEKKQKLWMGLGIALPLINFMLYIPCGMYNAAVHGIGVPNNPITIPSWLITAFDLRLYNRLITGVLIFLWVMVVLTKITDQHRRVTVSAIGFGSYLLVRLMVGFGPDWMMDYYAGAVTDLWIWATLSLSALLYSLLIKKTGS